MFYGLEDLFEEVWLVNAHHVKNVPGRKTEMSDAKRLADVAAHGMVRSSLVAPVDIRGLRKLTRSRTQIQARAQEIQRLERLFQDAGIKLTSVASQVWSKSSRAMVEMLISGQADPVGLAELAKGRMRSKIPALTEALEPDGNPTTVRWPVGSWPTSTSSTPPSASSATRSSSVSSLSKRRSGCSRRFRGQ